MPDRFKLSADEWNQLSYTQWEALLAIHHQRRLYVAVPEADALCDSQLVDATIANRQAESQRAHLDQLRALEKYPDFGFESKHHLCLQVYRVLYDILPRPDVPISPQMPPSLGRLFKGRDPWLAKIRQAIRERENEDAVRVVLHGTGGLGKTQLASEYAYACSHEHVAVDRQRRIEGGLDRPG
ncbi:MAG: hypothetical protein R3C05_28360 [Pirellulaceae bacterium]